MHQLCIFSTFSSLAHQENLQSSSASKTQGDIPIVSNWNYSMACACCSPQGMVAPKICAAEAVAIKSVFGVLISIFTLSCCLQTEVK